MGEGDQIREYQTGVRCLSACHNRFLEQIPFDFTHNLHA